MKTKKLIHLLLFILILLPIQAHAAEKDVTLDLSKELKAPHHSYFFPGASFQIYLDEDTVRRNSEYYAAYHIYPEDVAGKDSEVYVRFQLTKPSYLSFQMHKVGNSASANLPCELLRSDKRTVIFRKDITWQKPATVSYGLNSVILPAGNYYLHFFDFTIDACTTNCTMDILVPWPVDVGDDGGDSREEAISLSNGGASTEGFLSALGDDREDWYKIEVASPDDEITLSTSYRGSIHPELYYEDTPVGFDVKDGTINTLLNNKGTYYLAYKFDPWDEPIPYGMLLGGDYRISINGKPGKLAQPMYVSNATITLRQSKKKQTVRNALRVYNAQGTVTFKKKSGSAKVAVSKDGIVYVAKGAKKGTYTIKVKVTAAGNSRYKAGSRVMTVKVVIR